MNKILKIILITCFLFISFGFTSVNAADINNLNQINLTTGGESGKNSVVDNNTILKSLKDEQTDFTIGVGGEKGFLQAIIKIARDLKNLFFLIAGIIFIILVLKLLFSEKTEDEVGNFKKGIIWVSVGIIITQTAYYFINILYDKNINNQLSIQFAEIIIKPFINVLEIAASVFFLIIMIYAFYRIVSANGDEEKIKSGRMSILYAAIGFIVIKISTLLVYTIYGKTTCSNLSQTTCVNNIDLDGFSQIIVSIIDWINSFIGIVIILLVIYAGFTILISAGDEDKLKKAKNIIIYIAVGIFILVINYLILTFFIIPEPII